MAMSSPDRRIYQLHAELCQTLASPTRLEILNLLRDGEKCVGELTSATGIHQATMSQHLGMLRQRGVVATRKVGSSIFYRIANPKIIEACDIIRGILFEQLAEMEKLTRMEAK